MQDLPVVLITSADDSDDPLDMLKKESRSLLNILRPAEQAEHIRIHREESTRLKELYEDILYFDQRLVIFHYAGHADGDRLMFEGGAGRGARLAELLGKQQQLKLVFLNGCSTEGQVQALIEQGIPAVIATTQKVDDEIAFEFAEGFYMALAAGKSVPEAYFLAKSYILSDDGLFRDLIADADTLRLVAETDIPWHLHQNENAPVRDAEWSLFNGFTRTGELMVDLNGRPMTNPDGEAVHLIPPGLSLPGETIHCPSCGVKVLDAPEPRLEVCAICGSNDLERTRAPSLISHAIQPFAITADAARARMLDYLGKSSGVSASFISQLQGPIRFLAPAYRMKCGTRIEYDVELGTIVQQNESDWKYEWRSSSGSISVFIDEFLVNAGAIPEKLFSENFTDHESAKSPGDGPVSRDAVGPWLEDRKTCLQFLEVEKGTLIGQHTRGVQQAVDVLNTRHRSIMVDSISARFEADDYRGLEVDIRFESLSYRQALVPLWVFCAKWKGTVWVFTVCGRTGDVRGDRPASRWKFWKKFG